MHNQKTVDNIRGFMGKLQDVESKELFDLRLQYLIKRNQEEFFAGLDRILSEYNGGSWSCWRLNHYEQRNTQNKGKSIVIFGAGQCGRLTCRSMKYINRKVECFADNSSDLWGTEWEGIPICSTAEMYDKYKDSIIVIAVAGRQHQMDIYHQLIRQGVRESDIFVPQEGYLFAHKANQYFDLKEVYPETEDEVFVDAGCYNGQTSLDYGKLCDGKLRIVAFEPEHDNYLECDRRLKASGYAYELYERATWSDNATLRFFSAEGEAYASRIRTDGTYSVLADSIDNILKGRKATYIKYDVEGSELESLRGSIKTIQKYRPKLAISLYHKPEDIIEIPDFLEDLHLDYRYYIRHYQTRMQESILYAI